MGVAVGSVGTIAAARARSIRVVDGGASADTRQPAHCGGQVSQPVSPCGAP